MKALDVLGWRKQKEPVGIFGQRLNITSAESSVRQPYTRVEIASEDGGEGEPVVAPQQASAESTRAGSGACCLWFLVTLTLLLTLTQLILSLTGFTVRVSGSGVVYGFDPTTEMEDAESVRALEHNVFSKEGLFQNSFRGIFNELKDLQQNITVLKADLVGLQGNADASNKIQDLSNQLEQLKQQTTDALPRIDGLRTDLTNGIADANRKVDETKTAVDKAAAGVDDLNIRTTDMKGILDGMQTQINELKGKVEEALRSEQATEEEVKKAEEEIKKELQLDEEKGAEEGGTKKDEGTEGAEQDPAEGPAEGTGEEDAGEGKEAAKDPQIPGGEGEPSEEGKSPKEEGAEAPAEEGGEKGKEEGGETGKEAGSEASEEEGAEAANEGGAESPSSEGAEGDIPETPAETGEDGGGAGQASNNVHKRHRDPTTVP